ncbi:hypothetical protein HER21_11115 [Pseudomonas sp. BGM005]|nr:hypothetical protein [Pseudomonas sp. BG5]
MQAQHHCSSAAKATTPARHLVATAIIGAAMIGYLVQKTPASRTRLESLSQMAGSLGQLSDRDTAVVADLLAHPPRRRDSAAIGSERRV